MKILMISALFPTPNAPRIVGGAEVVARRLAEALVADGADVTVLRSAPPGAVLAPEDSGGITVASAAIQRPYWPFDDAERGALAKLRWHLREDFGDSNDVRRRIDTVRPDLIHTHNVSGLSTGVWRAATAAGVPIVHTLHDYYLLCPRATRFRGSDVCATPCTDCRMVTWRRRADTALVGDVVGVSGAVLALQTADGLFANARRHVVPNIIGDELIAAPVPVGDGLVTFGFLGRITHEKGVELLIEAFAAMRQPAQLVIGGRIDEATRTRLQAMAGDRAITFLGFVMPADFFRRIDVLVVPSIWDDPLPTVILEGQTAGKPAIGSTRGGIPEAIGSNDAGWIFDSGTPDALRTLLDTVAVDRAAINAKAGHAHAAAARFRTAGVVERYRAVYRAALDGSRPG